MITEDYVFEGFFNDFLDAIDGSYCTFSFDGITGNSAGLDPTYPDKARTGGFTGDLQCGVFEPTNVISFSYAVPEAALPPSYVQRQCAEYMKLAMQGVSLVFASGDAGVASAEGCSTFFHSDPSFYLSRIEAWGIRSDNKGSSNFHLLDAAY